MTASVVGCCFCLIGVIAISYHLFRRFLKMPYRSDPVAGDASPMHHPVVAGTPLSEVECLQPLTFPNGLKIRNRIVKAAAFGGSNFEQLIEEHVQLAKGGVGMTTIAYACVSRRGCTFKQQIVLDEHVDFDGLQRLARAVHGGGARISMQLTHGGSFADKSISKLQQLAPSPVFNPAGMDFPKEMTPKDMNEVCNEFVFAAKLCEQAGFDAIELHCGHGYLLSQWLSPYSNRRVDDFGGSVENRIKFPIRVLRAIKDAVSLTVVVKMNISDGFPGGLELGEACRNAKYFEEAGADALVLSGGFVSLSGFFMLRGKVPLWDMAKAMVRNSWTKGIAVLLFGKWLVPEIALEPCFFRAGARAILSSVRAVPVCVLGGINGLGAIEGAMKEGFAMVQMARALIREPFFVKRLIREIESSEELGGGQRKGSGGEVEVTSKCIHCNECVISSIDPSPRTFCSERLRDPTILKDIEDL